MRRLPLLASLRQCETFVRVGCPTNPSQNWNGVAMTLPMSVKTWEPAPPPGTVGYEINEFGYDMR